MALSTCLQLTAVEIFIYFAKKWNIYAWKKVCKSKQSQKSKKYWLTLIQIQTSKILRILWNVYCIHLIYFRKVVSGVQLTNGKVEKADIYILAMGIMANPMGRSIGINLPVYPLKGNIVTVPLKVKHKKKSQKIESTILSQLGTFRNECVQPRARFVDLSTQTQFGTNFRRRTGCRIQLEVISLPFCQNP